MQQTITQRGLQILNSMATTNAGVATEAVVCGWAAWLEVVVVGGANTTTHTRLVRLSTLQPHYTIAFPIGQDFDSKCYNWPTNLTSR